MKTVLLSLAIVFCLVTSVQAQHHNQNHDTTSAGYVDPYYKSHVESVTQTMYSTYEQGKSIHILSRAIPEGYDQWVLLPNGQFGRKPYMLRAGEKVEVYGNVITYSYDSKALLVKSLSKKEQRREEREQMDPEVRQAKNEMKKAIGLEVLGILRQEVGNRRQGNNSGTPSSGVNDPFRGTGM